MMNRYAVSIFQTNLFMSLKLNYSFITDSEEFNFYCFKEEIFTSRNKEPIKFISILIIYTILNTFS